MPLKSIDLLERVRNRVAPDAPARLFQQIDYIIETNIDAALARVGREGANSSEYKALQSEYAVTPTLGVLDLSITAYDAVLMDSIEKRGGIRLATGTTPVVRVPRYQSLFTKLQSDCVHYVMSDRKLYFRALDGTMPGAGGFASPLIMVANRIPTLDDLPFQFEDSVVDVLTMIVGTKVAPLLHADENEQPVLAG